MAKKELKEETTVSESKAKFKWIFDFLTEDNISVALVALADTEEEAWEEIALQRAQTEEPIHYSGTFTKQENK